MLPTIKRGPISEDLFFHLTRSFAPLPAGMTLQKQRCALNSPTVLSRRRTSCFIFRPRISALPVLCLPHVTILFGPRWKECYRFPVSDARRRGCYESRDRSSSAGALPPPTSTTNNPDLGRPPSPRVPESPVEILDDTTDEDEAAKTSPLEEGLVGGRNDFSAGATETAATMRSTRLLSSTNNPLDQETYWSKLKGLKVYGSISPPDRVLSLPLAYPPARCYFCCR